MNYKLTIQYDGTDFAGWQFQPYQKTVQGIIVESIEILLKEKVNLIGAGRTDAGVHAWGQIANFKTSHKLDLKKFKYSLNSILPKSIAIPDISLARGNFHSRYDAVLRSYIYIFSLEKNPFYNRFSYKAEYLANYNLEKLNLISKVLQGEKDFSSFAKSKTETQNKVCRINKIYWRRSGNFIIVLVEANRFLHGMVKTIVGTILQAYKEPNPTNYLNNILSAKDRRAAAQAVPSKGLCLFKVKY